MEEDESEGEEFEGEEDGEESNERGGGGAASEDGAHIGSSSAHVTSDIITDQGLRMCSMAHNLLF
jgi:hypothetical protein